MFAPRDSDNGLSARVSALQLRRGERERPLEPVIADARTAVVEDTPPPPPPEDWDEPEPVEEPDAPEPVEGPDPQLYQEPAPTRASSTTTSRASIEAAIPRIYPSIMERIDTEVAAKLSRDELARQLAAVIGEILIEQKIQLNQAEQRHLVTVLLDDMLGLGPLEQLLVDDSVTDIMVNGPKQVYVERKGKLELTDVVFRDNNHVMGIATRIVTLVGRRIDKSTPLVDARLQDGSRVNIIAPPLAIDGTSISIRKFAKKGITLDLMAKQRNVSPAMATVLKIAARARLNILISGGTGSGKTTLLNAMSQMIDNGDRIVTIEDAAELQLQQPHVVRLETRPPISRARARSRCAISSRTRCACGPTASSSAKFGPPRRSTCCRR